MHKTSWRHSLITGKQIPNYCKTYVEGVHPAANAVTLARLLPIAEIPK